MREETTAKGCNCLLDAIAQLIERARTLLMSGPRPFLQPALFRLFGLHARLVTQQPQQHKIGVHFAVHHGFQVKFDIRLACEAYIVTQDAQPQSVRDKTPQVSIRAVQKFLHKAMRAAAKASGSSPRIVIEINLEADEMDGRVLPAMRDRIASIIRLDWFARQQATITQFIEKRQQPPFSR